MLLLSEQSIAVQA